MYEKELETKIKSLPPEIKKELLEYIEKRLEYYKRKGKFNFRWEGGLKELKNEYTSVELQHKALEWR